MISTDSCSTKFWYSLLTSFLFISCECETIRVETWKVTGEYASPQTKKVKLNNMMMTTYIYIPSLGVTHS